MTDIAGFFQGFLADCTDVDVLNGSMRSLLGVVVGGQLVESLVWYLRDTNVGVSRIRMRLNRSLSQNAKERSLAYLW
jgi:hypothetical protein